MIPGILDSAYSIKNVNMNHVIRYIPRALPSSSAGPLAYESTMPLLGIRMVA